MCILPIPPYLSSSVFFKVAVASAVLVSSIDGFNFASQALQVLYKGHFVLNNNEITHYLAIFCANSLLVLKHNTLRIGLKGNVMGHWV